MISRRVSAFLSASALLTRFASSKLILPRAAVATFGFVTLQSHQVRTGSSYCSADNMATATSDEDLGYLDAASAFNLDQELMSTPGFCLEQLMELAGLSVAEAVYHVVYSQEKSATKILIVCGPGNNGGDGLVAARHLHHFGCTVSVVYPKNASEKEPHYGNLVLQCRDLDIPVLNEMPNDIESYAVIVDAIFGFSFRGEPRPPFDSILHTIREAKNVITVAVDVPSGWSVDGSESKEELWMPDVLVSLTAPKRCAKQFTGRHFVGGRFLPPALAEKYQIRMPRYPGVQQVVEIATVPKQKAPEDDTWALQYATYCAENEERQADNQNQSRIQGDEEESWEAQYAAYCAEKESLLRWKDQAHERQGG